MTAMPQSFVALRRPAARAAARPAERPARSPLSITLPGRYAGRRVHFVGVGGVGMSGLARVLLDAGAAVTGTDPAVNAQTLALSAAGVEVRREQDGRLVTEGVDLVVHTAAVHADHSELVAARRLGRRVMGYAELLGEVMGDRLGVAVAGTHGKSTTSAMVAHALSECGGDPSFVIGGHVPQLGGGSRSGGGPAFVAEACEFDRSFHKLRPTVALVTNVEEDHLDYYRDLDEIVGAFRHFAALVPAADRGGAVVCNGDDANTLRAVAGLPAVQTVGFGEGCDWRITGERIERGRHVGELTRRGETVARLAPGVPGHHNLHNAALAIVAASFAGADLVDAARAVASFRGVERRMTEMGRVNDHGVRAPGATVVDDYGHHPTEVVATLAALRERYSPRRLVCVFQPHQHSRTRDLMDGFASSFADADSVVLPPIFAARDTAEDVRAVTAACLAEKVNALAPGKAIALPDFSAVGDHLRRATTAGDLVVTMGAGDVWKVARDLVG